MLAARRSVRRLPTLLTPSASAPQRRVDTAPVRIGDRIARFRDPAFAAVPIPPFPAFITQPKPRGPLPSTFSTRPVFSTRVDARGSTSIVDIHTGPGTSFYGTGENAGTLLRNGTRVVCWNTDIPSYSDKSPSLYQSHPWVLALRPDGSAFGVICETTWRCAIDLTKGIRFEVEGPSPAITIIERDSAAQVLEALADLTGKPPLPPLWALGYHQCRYSYYPDAKVREIAREFRKRKIPCDVIWLDIDYMEGFRCFTFSRQHFPKPRKLFADLHKQDFKVVCMIDPGIKVDPEYAVYKSGVKGTHFVKNAKGLEYHGRVWPGDCAFPDFTRKATREWWGTLYKDFVRTGIDGVWNDMNEPAVFGGNGPGKTMPADNLHRADPALGGPDIHARYHNIYGMQMIRATRDGIAKAHPKNRPFVLTRANFLGGQRFGATWTGDNRSDWQHLAWSVPMALNLGLSGQPFAGPDIGGFIGNADAHLFARWMGIGTMLPFARAHTDTDSGPHEPWSFGKECEATCRRAIERRYRLLPYWYTLFRESSNSGALIIRPLWFADPHDPRLRGVDNAFLIGSDVLVWTNPRPGKSPSEPTLPRGRWKEFELGKERDHDLPRLFLREGAAIPLAAPAQSTASISFNSLTILANPLPDGSATAHLYLDAGDGHAHEKGDFALLRLDLSQSGKKTRLNAKRIDGKSKRLPKFKVELVK